MEDSSRRAYIIQQAAAKKKQEVSLPSKATSQANPSTKRKLSEKVDHPPKKPKVVTGPNAGETPAKLAPKLGSEIGKSLMQGHILVPEERPILLREDWSYALK